MSVLLTFSLGAMTYLSRAIGLVLMPQTENRLSAIFDRLPAALFAGLAVASMITSSGSLRSIPSLIAALAALATSPSRSLPLIFVAGIAGYLISSLVV